MKMIVGLGNPGKQYETTRHNVGFMAIDQVASDHQLNWSLDTKFQAKVATAIINGEKVVFVKPMTYMNESGQAVEAIRHYYKVDPADILILYDDLDLPIGKLRLRQSGSAGGHNGIKSIIAQLGKQNFKRLRIGIDRPKQQSVVDYVLGKVTDDEKEKLDAAFTRAQEAVEKWIQQDDFNKVMNQFNQKKED